MYFKNELDIMPGIYKCYGDIQYLRFKIRLEVIKSSMIPLSNVEEQETGLDPQYNEREELEFSWNEKIFSPREFKYYSDERNCKTALEKEYHDEISKLLSNVAIFPSNRLFTYTSKDNIPPNLHKNIFYKEEYSFQENKLLSPSQHYLYNTTEKAHDWSSLPIKNIIDYHPSNELRIQNRSLFSGCETMYIVADLSDKTHSSENSDINFNEYLLVTIKWNKRSCTLTVMPDFASFGTSGYKIDVDMLSDTRYVYRYWLLDVSRTEEESDLRKMEKLTGDVCYVTHRANNNFPLNFEIPFKNTKNVFIFVEIQKAVGFLCDNLFIQYYVFLPINWFVDNPEVLSGITQLCRCEKNRDIVTFSHLFEMKMSTMILDDQQCENDNKLEQQTPQFFFEICSLDGWERFRVEGYAWTTLPNTVGRHILNLNTWRPASLSRREELKRFFIGCDPQLSDFTYPGIPVNRSNGLLSRFGLETISSGSISMDLNIMHQTSTDVPLSIKASVLTDRNTTTLMKSVSHILEAFKKARQRMLLAREPILLHTE